MKRVFRDLLSEFFTWLLVLYPLYIILLIAASVSSLGMWLISGEPTYLLTHIDKFVGTAILIGPVWLLLVWLDSTLRRY